MIIYINLKQIFLFIQINFFGNNESNKLNYFHSARLIFVSISDDKLIYKWDLTSPTPSKVLELDSYPTDIDFPISKALSDCFAIGFGDGSFKLVNKIGKVEKSVQEAHKGAVISVRWSSDGYSLMTAGEDGFIKIWSKTGSKLFNTFNLLR
jgi:WD40 repeat protein